MRIERSFLYKHMYTLVDGLGVRVSDPLRALHLSLAGLYYAGPLRELALRHVGQSNTSSGRQCSRGPKDDNEDDKVFIRNEVPIYKCHTGKLPSSRSPYTSS